MTCANVYNCKVHIAAIMFRTSSTPLKIYPGHTKMVSKFQFIKGFWSLVRSHIGDNVKSLAAVLRDTVFTTIGTDKQVGEPSTILADGGQNWLRGEN